MVHRMGSRSTVFPRAILARACAASGATPTWCSRSSTASRSSRRCGCASRGWRWCTTCTATSTSGVRPAHGPLLFWAARGAAAAPALPAHAASHDLAARPATTWCAMGIPPRPHRRSSTSAWTREPSGRGARAPPSRACSSWAASRPTSASSACSTCSRPCRAPSSTSSARATTARPRGGDRAPRPQRPRAHARLRGRRDARPSSTAGLGQPHRLASEGWSLTVMEAALCRTPSAALAVGGLPESIVDGETGFLAHDAGGAGQQRVRELVARPRPARAPRRGGRAPGPPLHLGPRRPRPTRRAPGRGRTPAGGRPGPGARTVPQTESGDVRYERGGENR